MTKEIVDKKYQTFKR